MILLLKAVNVVPMNEETILENRDVLIDNNQIVKIGQNIDQPGARILDCRGKYAMPGLWDMHTHTNNAKCLNLNLANGVTSVRNMCGSPAILKRRDEIDAGKRTGPSIFSTSPLMDSVVIFEGSVIVKTPQDAINALDQAVKDGYSEIKTYPNTPREAYFTLMARARKLGLRVVGHANTSITTDELIESGYYAIEHASILFTAADGSEENVLKIAHSGMWLTPTLVVVRMMTGCAYENLDPTAVPHNEYADEEEKKVWRSMAPTIGEIARKRKYDFGELCRLTRVFIQNSDNVLLGTDQANPGIIAGFSLHEELDLNVSELGLTPYQAIRLGTVNAARYYGLSDQTGTVEEGKQADLLLLDGNPLEDVHNTQKIAAVIKGGVLFDRPALDALLEESKTMPYQDHDSYKVGDLADSLKKT